MIVSLERVEPSLQLMVEVDQLGDKQVLVSTCGAPRRGDHKQLICWYCDKEVHIKKNCLEGKQAQKKRKEKDDTSSIQHYQIMEMFIW